MPGPAQERPYGVDVDLRVHDVVHGYADEPPLVSRPGGVQIGRLSALGASRRHRL